MGLCFLLLYIYTVLHRPYTGFSQGPPLAKIAMMVSSFILFSTLLRGSLNLYYTSGLYIYCVHSTWQLHAGFNNCICRLETSRQYIQLVCVWKQYTILYIYEWIWYEEIQQWCWFYGVCTIRTQWTVLPLRGIWGVYHALHTYKLKSIYDKYKKFK